MEGLAVIGFVFGLVAYGTYNLTNMATVKNWSSIVVFIDITWGGLLSGFSAAATVYIMKIFTHSGTSYFQPFVLSA